MSPAGCDVPKLKFSGAAGAAGDAANVGAGATPKENPPAVGVGTGIPKPGSVDAADGGADDSAGRPKVKAGLASGCVPRLNSEAASGLESVMTSAPPPNENGRVAAAVPAVAFPREKPEAEAVDGCDGAPKEKAGPVAAAAAGLDSDCPKLGGPPGENALFAAPVSAAAAAAGDPNERGDLAVAVVVDGAPNEATGWAPVEGIPNVMGLLFSVAATPKEKDGLGAA